MIKQSGRCEEKGTYTKAYYFSSSFVVRVHPADEFLIQLYWIRKIAAKYRNYYQVCVAPMSRRSSPPFFTTNRQAPITLDRTNIWAIDINSNRNVFPPRQPSFVSINEKIFSKLVQGEGIKISYRHWDRQAYQTKKAGWKFDWKAEAKLADRKVYKLTIERNPNIIQGLLILGSRLKTYQSLF